MVAFNYISSLRDNCDDGPCGENDCEEPDPIPAPDCVEEKWPVACFEDDRIIEIEAAIAGVTDVTTGCYGGFYPEYQCSGGNGTHIFTPTGAPEQHWVTTSDEIGERCYLTGGKSKGCGAVGFLIDPRPATAVVRVQYSGPNFLIRWELTGTDATDAIDAMCAGAGPISLPNVQNTFAPTESCQGPGSATINILV